MRCPYTAHGRPARLRAVRLSSGSTIEMRNNTDGADGLGCGTTTTSRTASGTLMGAAGGAALGAIGGNAALGAAVGAGAGLIGGFLYDQHKKGNID